MLDLKKILVVNFAFDERTTLLSEECFKNLGFNNIITLNSNSGFVDKFIDFAEIAVKSDYEIFIRSDSDRLVFDGIFDLIEKFIETKVDCAEGFGHEYFMNTFRGATPHIFSKKILEVLYKNNDLMPRVQKPEATFVNNVVKMNICKEKTFKILTNLHEYEQFPSKVYNSFLNRIARGHLDYYDLNYLDKLNLYHESIRLAFKNKDLNKKSMDHVEYKSLDASFKNIKSEDLNKHYLKTKKIYDILRNNFNEKKIK